MQHHATCSVLALALFHVVAVIGQIVSPFATHDCSSETVYTGDTACNNDVTTCCAVTGTCCAGGCCPELAICVFMGTADEACCSSSDPTLCGSAQPATSKTCPNPAGPSVPCSGVDSSWYCAAGCTCDVSIEDGCNCFGGGSSDCSDDGGSGDSSSEGAAASTEPAAATPTPAAPTTTAPLEGGGSSVGGGSGSQTTAGGGGGAGGSGATVVSSAAVPAATTKAGAGRIRGEVMSGVGLGLLVVGVGLIM